MAGATGAVVLAALAVAGVWAAERGSAGGGPDAVHRATPSASATAASPAARLLRPADVEVRRGQAAAIRYKLVAPLGARAEVVLVVTDAAGRRIKARRLLDARGGAWVTSKVPVDFAPGEYTYALLLDDQPASASGAGSPAAAASATLTVLAPLPPAFPGENAVAAAEEWIAARDGEAAFAVVDSRGRVAGGYDEHEPFQLASLAKAILLVASLRHDPAPDEATEATLTMMVTESDNTAAWTIFAQVGAAGMQKVADLAGMRDYEQGADWVTTRASAWDEARFFWELESLVPEKGRPLARRLLSGVVPIQRWGIPAAAGSAGWTSYFKGGWLGEDNELMVQAAWLEKGDRRWSLAVMTDDDPTRSYGWDTQKGVTGLLLGQEPTPAYLSVVLQ